MSKEKPQTFSVGSLTITFDDNSRTSFQTEEQVTAVINLLEQVREACAKICDNALSESEAAAEIRARGQRE